MQKEPPVLFVMKSLYLWRAALQLEWNRTATENTCLNEKRAVTAVANQRMD